MSLPSRRWLQDRHCAIDYRELRRTAKGPSPRLISSRQPLYSSFISHEMLFAHERQLCARSGPSPKMKVTIVKLAFDSFLSGKEA
jgi:hypothetical protein